MKFRKVLALTLCAATVAGLALAGCGNAAGEGETDSIYGKNHLVDSQALRPNHAGKKDPIKEAENP